MNREFDRFALKNFRGMQQPKMRQADLAKLVKRSRVSISDIERGALKPSFDLICDMADALHVEPSQLFKSNSSKLGDLPLPDDEKRLLAAFRQMSVTTKGIILSFLMNLSTSDLADISAVAKRVRAAVKPSH